MAYSPEDILLLETLVKEERGEQALEFVNDYVNTLRKNGDIQGAAVWTKVLALLFHEEATSNHDNTTGDNPRLIF